jgi:NAD(P)-dependent dehydrogenase (short-subunit alcohol dehydrogenase family)
MRDTYDARVATAGDIPRSYELPAESRGEAPGRGRMFGRRVMVVGAGQTDFGIPDQPVGNGRAISLLLAREGARVVAVDRNASAAETTVELIEAAGGQATAVIADVAEPRSVVEMVERSREWLGDIDGVAYNVGIPGVAGLDASTPEAWDEIFAVNLRGAMLTARAALPVMSPGSSLVFISSIAALKPTGRIVAYESSKAALGGLMRAVAFEGKDRAIRANIAMLGLIDTGLGRSADRGGQRATIPVPLGRQGTAWEVAYAALFLLSHESAYITGQILAVDGGRTGL